MELTATRMLFIALLALPQSACLLEYRKGKQVVGYAIGIPYEVVVGVIWFGLMRAAQRGR